MLRTSIVSHEQQQRAGEKKLKAQDSDHFGRLFAVDARIWKVSTSAEVSLTQQSALELEVKYLWSQLYVAVSTPAIDVEAKLAYVREESLVTIDMIGKLHNNLETGRDHIDFIRKQASAQSFRPVDKRLKAKWDQHRKGLAWEKLDMDLGLKLSSAVDSEAQVRELNTKRANRFTSAETRSLCVTGAGARVVAVMKDLGKRLNGFFKYDGRIDE